MNNEENSDNFGQLDHFKRMAERVPAYRAFLKEQAFDPATVKTLEDLTRVPITNKTNYIDRHDLADLCWDGVLASADYIVNSSGSTGVPYFWPRDSKSDEVSGQIYETIFRQIFGLDKKPTLFIDSFAAGSWIAGIEAFLASNKFSLDGEAIVALNSGIDSDIIIKQLEKLSSYFERIIFAGYPPFIKDLFDEIEKNQLDLSGKRLYVIVGGESISEAWRRHLGSIITTAKLRSVVSIYGMSDGGGILAFETPMTQKLRSIMLDEGDPTYDLDSLGGALNTALFKFDPALRYFEMTESSNLLIHAKHGLPLFKYDTKDRGGVVGYTEFEKLNGIKSILKEYDQPYEKLPFVYLLGRSDYAQSLYGLLIYPEHIRSIIDGINDDHLTGRFVMETVESIDMTQELHISLELSQASADDSKSLASRERALEDLIYNGLPLYSTEYAKLSEAISTKARPIVHLKPYGTIGYQKGKKHSWVKRN